MTPQDVSDLKAADKIREKFRARGQRAVCYGMGDGLDEVKKASSAEKISWFLLRHWNVPDIWRKTFGTPYEVGYPLAEELVPDMDYTGKRFSSCSNR